MARPKAASGGVSGGYVVEGQKAGGRFGAGGGQPGGLSTGCPEAVPGLEAGRRLRRSSTYPRLQGVVSEAVGRSVFARRAERLCEAKSSEYTSVF